MKLGQAEYSGKVYEFYSYHYGSRRYPGFVVALEEAYAVSGYYHMLFPLNKNKINWNIVIEHDGTFIIPDEIKTIAQKYYDLMVFL